MKRSILAAAMLVTAPLCAKDHSTTERVGDVLQIAVPASAMAVAWAKDDTEGMWQAGKGILITAAITQGLKCAIEEQRPNGRSSNSFPSGHTSAAFSGATFLGHRYGWKYGLPAYMAASYVGYSRVYAAKHWQHDVLVGAALAYGVSHFVTSKYQDPNLVVAPLNVKGAQGISFNYVF